MAPDTASRRSVSSRVPGVVIAFIALVVVAALVVHLYALSLDRDARDVALSLPERAEAAQLAAGLEPFNARIRTTDSIVRAQELATENRVDEAYFLLLPLSKTVRGDALFRATYQEIVRAKWSIDARKAHQQHAREAVDGALAPEDVFR